MLQYLAHITAQNLILKKKTNSIADGKPVFVHTRINSVTNENTHTAQFYAYPYFKSTRCTLSRPLVHFICDN